MLDQLSNDAYTSLLHMNRAYLLHANRARALSRLGLYAQGADALAAGLQVAPDVETRCKCLAYLGWAIIKQRDRSKLDRAWASFDQFERETDGKDIPPILLSLVRP
jgi:hypothetical protein